MTNNTLYLFRFSHFCEKVSWAAEFKQIKHQKRYLLPGLHAGEAKKLSGQTAVPILACEQGIITGSHQIIQHWENTGQGRELTYGIPKLDQEALDWAQNADAIGPDMRSAFFCDLFTAPREAAKLFCPTNGLSHYCFPLFMQAFAPLLRKKLQQDPDIRAKGIAKTKQLILRVEKRISGADYLVGDRFSLADLTVAAMLFPCCFPESLEHRLSENLAARLQDWFDIWSQYEGIDWVRGIYQQHRFNQKEVPKHL